MEVTVSDMLNARDNRVLKQKELLNKFRCPLICFTMNIAGPIKINPLIKKGFNIGIDYILSQIEGENLQIVHFEKEEIFTGCTAYFSVNADGIFIKKLMSEIEDSSTVGRIFDIDVLKTNGEKISREEIGLKARKCLICEKEAMICSSSRAHSLDELKSKTDGILFDAVKNTESENIASAALKALMYEVCTTPKPGLVDCQNNGSHKDMDIFTFLSSISVLFPYFKECAICGINTRDLSPEETFKKLRFKGKIAQNKMFKATNGVNTHKGAIFSLGIICAAAGRMFLKDLKCDDLLCETAKIVKGITEELNGTTDTAGKKMYKEYGIKGIRGQAESGFPAVRDFGLPTLLKGIESGLSVNDAGIGALLSLICNSEDTNLFKRTDKKTANALIKKVKEITEKSTFLDKEQLIFLDNLFTKYNASPGGSADLLSLCYFLYFYKKEPLT